MERKRARSAVSPPKKPPPEARGPNRAWSGAWSGKGDGGPSTGTVRRPRPASAPKRDGEKGPNGVSEGVALGYRVIQEYLRQGERVARSFWNLGDDEADRYDPGRLIDRTLRSAQDLAGAFSEMVRALAKNAPPPRDGASPGGFDTEPARRATRQRQGEGSASGRSGSEPNRSGPILTFSVQSRRPVKVALQLEPASAARAFRVRPLARSGAGAARLGGISIAIGEGNEVALTVVVPPRLAAGRYEGEVLDARTGRPVGYLSVDVGV